MLIINHPKPHLARRAAALWNANVRKHQERKKQEGIMKTTRFDSADKLTWEPIIDDDTQQAMNDMNEIAIVVGETIKFSKRQHAGDVHGAMGPVGLYIYTMEDDDWVYIAHYINEVEHQCFLFRHRKYGESRG